MNAVLPNPRLRLSALKRKALMDLDDQAFTIREDGFNFPVRLRIEPGADRLFVMFHGSIDRNARSLPAFARWNWGKILGGHVLAVCDPTLYLSKGVWIGWFLGSAGHHAVPGLVTVATKVAHLLAVADERVIYYGSSGGGFSAIQAACHVGSKGRAIAVNPQTDILKYHGTPLVSLAKALGSRENPLDLATLPRTRTDALHAYETASKSRKGPRIVVAQNTTDEFHLENHYGPFVSALGLDRSGEMDTQRRLGAILFTAPGGHNMSDPKDLVNQIRNEVIPFLLAGPARPWWTFWR